ncbi:MAG: RNA polymerase sigma factor [Flavobacteriales bacterium]
MLTNNTKQHNLLVTRLQQKDTHAFSELYDNYSAALYGVIIKMVHNQEKANDILQDVFVKIWKNIDRLDLNKGSLYTWMLNITRNTTIDFLRSKNERVKIQSTEDNVALIDRNNNHTLNTDTLLLKELVEKLPAEQREIINLAYYCGRTQEEIAEELNIPLGTVKTRTRTALRELRKIMAKA